MGWSTLVGLLLAFAALLASNLMEHGNPLALLNGPGAVIVFGGTIGSALVSFPPQRTLGLPSAIGQIFKQKLPDHREVIAQIVELADKARRQGLLSLEEEANKLSDNFMRQGLQLVVDGIDPDVVRSLLEVETERTSERHAGSYGVLAAMGGYAPTMGIIGTVMGLVNVLGNMEDPSKLAGSIATAFLATFYGVGSANLVWLPLASKLKQVDEEEALVRSIMTEGILSIQAGDNPRVVRTKLEAFLSVKDRTKDGETVAKPAAAGAR
jgi:chemotaxis protein MotA